MTVATELAICARTIDMMDAILRVETHSHIIGDMTSAKDLYAGIFKYAASDMAGDMLAEMIQGSVIYVAKMSDTAKQPGVAYILLRFKDSEDKALFLSDHERLVPQFIKHRQDILDVTTASVCTEELDKVITGIRFSHALNRYATKFAINYLLTSAVGKLAIAARNNTPVGSSVDPYVNKVMNMLPSDPLARHLKWNHIVTNTMEYAERELADNPRENYHVYP